MTAILRLRYLFLGLDGLLWLCAYSAPAVFVWLQTRFPAVVAGERVVRFISACHPCADLSSSDQD